MAIVGADAVLPCAMLYLRLLTQHVMRYAPGILMMCTTGALLQHDELPESSLLRMLLKGLGHWGPSANHLSELVLVFRLQPTDAQNLMHA